MVGQNSQSVCQIKQFCFIILTFVFCSVITEDLLANNYLSLLQEGSTLRYEHWNLDRKEVTGYSNFLQIYQNEGKRWIEQNANTKPDGEVFTRKQLIFTDDGEIGQYTEEDLRDIYQVSTTYQGLTSKSVLNRSGEIRSFEQKLEKDTVTLELIMLHMRLLMPELLKDKEVKFPIYASILALELEEQGLSEVRVMNGVGCEKFAEQAFHFANDLVQKQSDGRCFCVSCEVREHGANSAIYEG